MTEVALKKYFGFLDWQSACSLKAVSDDELYRRIAWILSWDRKTSRDAIKPIYNKSGILTAMLSGTGNRTYAEVGRIYGICLNSVKDCVEYFLRDIEMNPSYRRVLCYGLSSMSKEFYDSIDMVGDSRISKYFKCNKDILPQTLSEIKATPSKELIGKGCMERGILWVRDVTILVERTFGVVL